MTLHSFLNSKLAEETPAMKTAFCDSMGINKSTLSRWLTDVSTPSGDYAVAILEHFKMLKEEWR